MEIRIIIMRYLSPFILVAFTCFAYPHVNYANAASGDIHYEQCSKPIHEVYDLKGGNDELIERRAHEPRNIMRHLTV